MGSEEMREIDKKVFWFVVGSQHLYGEEVLQQVSDHAKEIVAGLNEKAPFEIVLKDIVKTADEITAVVKEANYQDDVAGIITWMHTFSPAKMWIQGMKLLQKPLLHLATQFNESIPWETIDMDFMNLNQAAHGDQVEAAIQFGWTVDYFGIGDLVAEMNQVSEADVEALYSEIKDLYDFDLGANTQEAFDASVKEQLKIEIALERFMDEGGYNAFTSNFEDLHGMKQLPGLAVQRLMAKGYGFAGEGDWKTAALDRLLKVMTLNQILVSWKIILTN